MSQEEIKLKVKLKDSLREVLDCIQNNKHKFCVALNEDGQICGTITDGDCRRALLKGYDLNTPAELIMNTQFIVVNESFSNEQIYSIMSSNSIDQVPIVDNFKRFKSVVSRKTFLNDSPKRNNPVVILAGGKGTRLRPLTQNLPKPMLDINGKPMLEHIINKLVLYGYSNIFISINYLGEIIEEHFGDGSKFSCQIKYLKENKELGTGGPLKLLENHYEEPIIVINGDLVTSVDFGSIADFHIKHKYDVTIAISNYSVEIPFGVVNLKDNGEINSIQEKPTVNHQVNAGLYVINPELLKIIPRDEFYPITKLIDEVITKDLRVGAFPIHETWTDVGILSQYLNVLNAQ